MITQKKLDKIIIVAIIIAVIVMIIAILVLIQRASTVDVPPSQSDTSLTDPDNSTQDSGISDPFSVVQELLDTDSADPIIRQLSIAYTALEAGDTNSANAALSGIDPSSLEGDVAIFYHYDSYLYNSAVGNFDDADSDKAAIDTLDKNRNL